MPRLLVDEVVKQIERHMFSPDELKVLATHRSPRVRTAVAASKDVDNETLTALARDEKDTVRLAAASNAVGRPAVELEFAHNADPWVRAVLAHTYAGESEGALGRDVQSLLADDDFWEVRSRVAETTNQRDVYARLLEDADARVRGACAANEMASTQDLKSLLSDKRKEVRSMAIASGKAGRVALLGATGDASADVRWAALEEAEAQGAVDEVGKSLENDPDKTVRHHAREYRRK